MFVFFPPLCYIRTTKEAYLYDWFYHCKHCNGCIIKGTVDIVKQLRQTIRRRDEARRVIEYARLHSISIREAHEILHND